MPAYIHTYMPPHIHSLSHTDTHIYILSLSCPLSLTHTHTHPHSLSILPYLTLSLSTCYISRFLFLLATSLTLSLGKLQNAKLGENVFSFDSMGHNLHSRK